MAKVIRYKFLGPQEAPDMERSFTEVVMGWNEVNEETAKKEAYNGEYTIEEEDGTVRPSAQDDTDAILVELEYRVTLLELGLTEE